MLAFNDCSELLEKQHVGYVLELVDQKEDYLVDEHSTTNKIKVMNKNVFIIKLQEMHGLILQKTFENLDQNKQYYLQWTKKNKIYDY